jgi:hypothetical protein
MLADIEADGEGEALRLALDDADSGTSHALAVAVKTRPSSRIESSEVSSTTMGVPHEPDHVDATLPDPDVDAMMPPFGESLEAIKGPPVPL